ncbi:MULTISPECIES: glycine/sarcosine/betaine reductase component B subunit [Enterococcus]|uniref:D-proline reductase (Dithiol)-stabilizing protein PrdE n=1 Tax=Candidatus Enterococcus ferrettii TaxID=2815324 RepID=A0ABV0ES01_9ENTE|nr:glycine/sarcosine/betaine reductase component B subunit [Enterococcus sp. 665A]MBO1340400.1 proline reductase [Enterococcus sp. 665A]
MGLGASMKETTLHHYRDPFVELLAEDAEIDLLGVIIMGSADDTPTKILASNRTAQLLCSLKADGAILSCNGFGNNHVDYANLINEVGKNKLPFVAMSVCDAENFVVTNNYLTEVLPFYKSNQGKETGILAQNTVTKEDAQKAIARLRLKMRHS